MGSKARVAEWVDFVRTGHKWDSFPVSKAPQCVFFNLFTHNISLVICCLSSPQLPARLSLKAPDVREVGKMTAGKFAIHFFFSYVRRLKIISKNRLFYNHFFLISPLLFITCLPKKGFHASRCACGQFAKSYKTGGLLLKASALCLIAASTLKDVVFCRKWCTFKVVMFVILSPCLLLFQYLNLLNGERLYLSEYVKLIFETDDLTDASPSTVSRCVSMVLSQLFL